MGYIIDVNAQTNVSGGIYSNTTWTLANSPYVVTDTVVVFPNVTLTIEPGVVVKFNNTKVLEIRQGTIIAIGTLNDSITFTSNAPSPYAGIWDGVFLNQCIADTFNYCKVMYADQGIYHDQFVGTDNLIIKNSYFANNVQGYWTSKASVDSCVFENNTFGTKSHTNGHINYCKYYNNQTAMNVGGATIKINYCIINSNETGIHANSSTRIKNCTIDSNSITGVFFGSGFDSVINCEVKYNGIGVWDATTNNQVNCIKSCFIENNTIGIKVHHSQASVYCNKICNNSDYDFYNDVSFGSNFSIANNYWCTNDSATVASHIYDGYDNISLSLVSFMPIDTIGCYLTGCNLSMNTSVTNATCATCTDGSATVNPLNGFAPYTYTWYSTPIQTTQTATGLVAGNYSICITDANGCTACGSVFIDSSNCTGFAISAQANNATCSTCNDGTAWVNINGGTAPFNYTWYTVPMQSNSTATGLVWGDYFVCVTDVNGCAACDSVTVGIGSCSAHFNLSPDTALHTYIATNMASGVFPLTYSWNWGDGSPNDTLPFPSHTYATAGFYSICLTITDSVGCSNTYCTAYYLQKTTNTIVTVNVVPAIGLGVNENFNNQSVFIYPNPVNDYLFISFTKGFSNADIKIYDLAGRLEISAKAETGSASINVAGLNKGFYFIETTTGKQINRQRFVKQ